MTFVIDIDDTLLLYPENKEYADIWRRYKDAIANHTEIERVNYLYENGHKIILHTGRNWDKYEITKNQLAEFNINHHELVMGKPQGVYIDKDSYKTVKDCMNDFKLLN
jgi:hydroxymethylpyrimidine pyrophosphatase-like HAD family hydrolase